MRIVLVSSRSFGSVATVGSDLLQNAGYEVHIVRENDRPLDSAKLASIVANEQPEVLIPGAEPVPEAVLAVSKGLRMVMKHGVGVDNIDIDAATSMGIAVANAPGTNCEAVADLAVGLMLSVLRHICPANRSTRSGAWHRYMGHEVGALVVGIVGTGRIGAAVGRRLSGFGAKLLGYDVVQNSDLVATYGMQYVSLNELLKKADIVTLHAPLVPETVGLIGEDELDLMLSSALLVNCARGELVDEQALHAALASGSIAGAAVDVFATEPPQDSALLELENVLATPHIAAYTYEAMVAMDRMCAETIIEVMIERRTTQNLLNPVVLSNEGR